MPLISRSSLAVLSLACVASAYAQTPEAVSMTGRALVHQRQDSIEGCGMRLTGESIAEPVAPQSFEIVANVFRSGRAGVKLALLRSATDARRAPGPRALEGGWVAAPPAERAEPVIGGYLPSDGGGAVVYSAAFNAVMAVLRAQASNVAITVAFKSAGDPAERLYAGRIAMEAEEAMRLSQCLRDVLPRVGEAGR